MGVTSYYSFGGEIIGEETGGVRRDYLTDALGSVTATVTDAGVVENTYRYKPYGEQLAKTGTGNDPKPKWLGTVGYRSSNTKFCDSYVRARHYGSLLGRWNSKDPIGIINETSYYIYVSNRPTLWSDPSGLKPPEIVCSCRDKNDIGKGNECIARLCDPKKENKIKKCADKLKSQIPLDDIMTCFRGWCTNENNKNKIECSHHCSYIVKLPCKGCPPEYDVPPCAQSDQTNPEYIAVYCCYWEKPNVPKGCPDQNCKGLPLGRGAIHELGHICGKISNAGEQQVIDFEDCLFKSLGCK